MMDTLQKKTVEYTADDESPIAGTVSPRVELNDLLLLL